MKRHWQVNISVGERVGRVLVGLVGAIAGIILLTTSTTFVTQLFETLLVLAGLDLVVTGAIGHCPLYQKLGHVPRSLRRA